MSPLFRWISLAMLFTVFATVADAQTDPTVSLEAVRPSTAPALLRSCVLLSSPSALRYELVGEAEGGVAYLEIGTAERIIDHRECRGQSLCRLAGAITTVSLKSDIVSVQAAGTDGRIQTEKIKLNLKDGGEKIYMVMAVPGMTPPAAIPDLALRPEGATGTTEIPVTTVVKKPAVTKGPDLTVGVTPGDNQYTLAMSAKDISGVDFIEILEDGSFYDVQVCDGLKECSYSKTITNRPPGRYRYIVKTMNLYGGLSYKEEFLEFK